MDFKRLSIAAAVIAAALSCVMFFDLRLGAGLLAGFLTGAVNLAAIAVTVKALLRGGSDAASAPAGTAVAAVLVYFVKIALIGAVIAALVIYRKFYSIKGFLIGFTLTLLLILAEGAITALKEKNTGVEKLK